jgi:hypothetical protein
MVTTKMLLVVIVLFLVGVVPDSLKQSKGLNRPSHAKASTLGEKNSLGNTIGVITLNEKAYNKTQKLQFFNEDGSVWYELSFYDEDANDKFDREKVGFEPFSFHPDYFVLALKCLRKDAERFEVVVNETTRLTKFIRRHDNNFKFQTWQEHILALFAVGFDPSNNPLRRGPRDHFRPMRLRFDNVTFHPLQIHDNWLKVSWNVSDESNSKDRKVRYGWVKWKQNRQLLIELFYFS